MYILARRHVVIYKKGHEPPDVELHGVRHDGMVRSCLSDYE